MGAAQGLGGIATGDFTIPVSVTLGPGHYWLSLTANPDPTAFPLPSLWAWNEVSPIANDPAVAEATGTGPCTTWMTLSACSGPGARYAADLMFKLLGQRGTVITAYPQFVLSAPGSGAGVFTAEATLTSGRVPLSGQSITFTSGGMLLCSGVTNTKGMAVCHPGLLGALAVLATNTYTATYAGDDNYLASTVSTPALELGP